MVGDRPQGALGDSGIHVAAVATAFPSGRASCRSSSPTPATRSRPAPTRSTWSSTAARSSPATTSRSSTRSPRSGGVRRATAAARTSRSSWRPASWSPTTTSAGRPGWRCWPGATSSRPPPARSRPAATLPVTLVMLEAVRDWRDAHRRAGRRQAGRRHPHQQGRDQVPRRRSTRSPGDDWLDPDWFRFGASSLLNDLLLQRQKLRHRGLLRRRLRDRSTRPRLTTDEDRTPP